ncbi:MAG: hypothetical protein RIC35_22280 [Marinoscillum sp.]
MNKSFDEKLKERLEYLDAQPKEGAKKALFDKLPASAESGLGYAPYHYFAGVLLLLSLFMIGQAPLPQEAKGIVSDIEESSALSNKSDLQVVADSEELVDSTPYFVESNGEQLHEFKNIQSTVQSSNINPAPSSDGPIPDAQYDSFSNLKWLGYSNDYELNRNRNLRDRSRYIVGPKSIIPKRDKFFNPYFEAGAFFLYNRLKPNLDDDIYVGDYDSPFGMSISRIGVSAHVGLQHSWTERFSTRFGMIFNNYNQNFSFNVRSVTPDSVIVGAEFVEPVFNVESVEIKKRVSTLGLKVQTIWNFPSEYNSLYAGFELHRRITEGAKFTYGDQTYELSSPYQYLVELGLRKRVINYPSGALFIQPGIRYALTKFDNEGILSVKPFSVGVSLNYSLK